MNIWIIGCGHLDMTVARQQACGVMTPRGDLCTPCIAKEKRAPVFPENIGVKSCSHWIVLFGPLCLPVCVSQDGPPFGHGKGWEVACAPFQECATKEEEMVIKYSLVLCFTTPKELNWGEGKPSR